MLNNGENLISYNDFTNVPYLPYKILEELLTDNSKEVNDLWKLLKYVTIDSLDNDDLTDEEKYDMIWKGQSMEQDYNIFLKPLVSSSLDSAESQTQMRLYRYNTTPTNRFDAIVTFQIDFLTNDKTCLVESEGLLCERTDLMVSKFLQIFNGRDLGIGILEYDRGKSRSCQDLISINNSKNIYGRSIIMALRYCCGEIGADICG